jgi:hypothetical protein
MLTVILKCRVRGAGAAGFWDERRRNWGWSVFWGVVAFAAGQVAAGFLIQRRVKAGGPACAEDFRGRTRKRLQAKVNQWQTRPPGSLKQAQIEIEREQRVLSKGRWRLQKRLERFNRWAPLMGRQLARCVCSSIGCSKISSASMN